MELELTRINYGSINTTLSNCLQLVPTGDSSKQQKVAVGDLEGNFQMFGIKKSEAQIIFQTYVGTKVSSIQMGGVPGTILDKIFVASDNVVKAYTKKGKMFLSFDTNLTEAIKCMFVSGADLVICGNHVYSHYRDCKDVGTYLCGDTIVDVVALCPNNTNRILTILACSGRVLRILEHCRVRQTLELDSVPTVLHVLKNALGDRILCGFADGKVVLFQFGPFTGETKQKVLVDVASSPNAVTCIDTYDMSGDGRDELIIGRRDGTIQVFTLPTDDDIDMECRQIYKESFSESISAVRGGCVYSQGWSEIVVLLYSGNIFGLTTQVISVSLSNKEVIKQPFSSKNLERVPTSVDRKSIASGEDGIKASLVKPIENYQLSAPIQSNAISSMSIIQVNDSLTLDKTENCYNLFIELPTQIAEILLESEAVIRILNADEQTDYNIVNLSENQYHFKGKIKMREDCNRFEMKLQTIEGQYGTMEALIIPRFQESNAQMRSYVIRPLSLHLRCHTFDSTRLYNGEEAQHSDPMIVKPSVDLTKIKPLNILTLKGSFSHSEMHNWIEQCIPEVPERLSATEMSDLYFENTLIGTILECKYGRGNAQFRSDNLSTISILKDFLTKEATKKRIKLEMHTEISEPSVTHVLHLIESSVMDCIKIKKEYTYLQALLQVDIRNDADFNCLMPEYQSILNRRAEIEENFKKTPAVLDKYFGILTDFYIDRFKFKGIFVKEKIPQLMEVLENFNMDKLLVSFNASESKEINMEMI